MSITINPTGRPSKKTPQVRVCKKQYQFLKHSPKRFVHLFGGASSGKSWTVAQFLTIEKLYSQPNCGIMIIRKTRPMIKASCYRLVKTILDTLEWPYFENKSDLTITSPIGSTMFFEGLDKVEKKKSYEGINYIWVEEATEINLLEYMQLNLRCRAANSYGINQLFMSYNPVDPVLNEWLQQISENPDTHTDVMQVTYRDNPFLGGEEILQIENLINIDPEYYAIYNKGEWATPTYIIYRNWDVVPNIPAGGHVSYGLDFGYNEPTALVKITIKDRVHAYLEEMIYQTKLTNAQLIEKMKELIPDRSDPIIADCAEPDRIQEIYDAGFNVWPCIKGPSSITTGIDRVKRYRLHVLNTASNIYKEIKSYKNKIDKAGRVLDEPVDFMNHAMDAIRYCLGNPPEVEGDLIEIGQLQF